METAVKRVNRRAIVALSGELCSPVVLLLSLGLDGVKTAFLPGP